LVHRPPTPVVSYKHFVKTSDGGYQVMVAELTSDRLDSIKKFFCGVPEQDDYLRNNAWNEQRVGLNKTLLFLKNGVILGYVTYGTSNISNPRPKDWREQHGIAYGGPDPVLIIIQFAVAKSLQGKGLGRELLRFVMYHLTHLALQLGTVGITLFCVMDKFGKDRIRFYKRAKFVKLADKPGKNNRIQMFYSLDKVLDVVYS
jgi:GNAT superfamily N-acetyltransferase